MAINKTATAEQLEHIVKAQKLLQNYQLPREYKWDSWPTTWSIHLREDMIITTIRSIERALKNFSVTERRSPMLHEVMEIVIGRIALTLADEGGAAFDSLSFYAKVKGKPE